MAPLNPPTSGLKADVGSSIDAEAIASLPAA